MFRSLTCCKFPYRVLAFSALLTLWLANSHHAIAGETSPEIGDKVEPFTLPIVGSDSDFDLAKALQDGPVAVVVLRGYPGYQCPICSRQVSAFANRIAALKKLTKHVVFVYPGQANALEKRANQFLGSRKLVAPLVMVRDPDMKMVSQWGLRWNAPRETAYPSSFVIRSSGEVAWKKVSQSHGGRSTAEQVITELRKISPKS